MVVLLVHTRQKQRYWKIVGCAVDRMSSYSTLAAVSPPSWSERMLAESWLMNQHAIIMVLLGCLPKPWCTWI